MQRKSKQKYLHSSKKDCVHLLAVFLVCERSHVYWLKLTKALIGTVISVLRNATPSSTFAQNYKTIENSYKLLQSNSSSTKCKENKLYMITDANF